jgi:hypothetical protein
VVNLICFSGSVFGAWRGWSWVWSEGGGVGAAVVLLS